MKTIHLLPGVREAIAGQLVSAYPHEGCGALVGVGESGGAVRVLEAVGMKNVEPTRGEDRYQLDPLTYRDLEEKLGKRSDGACVAGFFHSHPDGIAQPSLIDLEMAQGLFEFTRTLHVYAIQVITQNGAGELTFWRLAQTRTGFEQLSVE
jgi:proteasome lid subunit RPN8/RPN11